MLEHGPDRPLTPNERRIYGVFLLLVLGLFVGELLSDYQPAKLSALFVLLAWIPLLAIHEAGHAIVARLCGWRVPLVVIGFGRVVGRLFVGRTLVELRVIPIEGFAVPVPPSSAGSLARLRLQSAAVYFGGAAAELIVLALCVAVGGVEGLLTRSSEISTIALQSVSVAVLLGLFVNLVPHSVLSPGSESPTANDGLGILRSLFAPRSHFERLASFDPDERS